MSERSIEEVRKEADDLGISYSPTAGVASIEKKIEKFYVQKEESAETVQITESKKNPEGPTQGEKTAKAVAEQRKEAAYKLRKVIIHDNDRRVNEETTTAVASCANEYFDLGKRLLPLGEVIECAMGHIRNLQQVQIPVHVKNDKTGLSQVRMRNRYNVSFQD